MKIRAKVIKVLLSIITTMSIVLVLSLIIVKNVNKKSVDSSFNKTTNAYISEESEISSIGEGRTAADEYLRLNTLYTISGSNVSRNSTAYDGSTVISISTPEELYAFSVLCKNNTAFLTYDYALLNNVDYAEYGESHYFYPIGCLGTAFSGTFNGNGYDITKLALANLTDSNISSGGQFADYVNIEYFAMFGELTGTVENLGLINTDINISASGLSRLQYVSPLVGNNQGTVKFCYAQDLRNAASEEGGITAAGAYQVSGLVAINTGVLSNSYSAYSIIVNYTLSMTVAFWHEVLLSNVDGTVSNLFYYNASIPEDGGFSVSDDQETIIYDATLIGRTLSRQVNGSTYEPTLEALNDAVADSSTSWYTNESYGSDLYKALSEEVVTPILRGLEYDNETKTFTIENEYDYVYMYELFNISSYFASNVITYKFVNDIDLLYIPQENYTYSQNIGCKLVGESSQDRKTIKTVSGDYSEYPTIFNATIYNTVINEGMNCYGVFPWFTGNIKGLNFYFDNTQAINLSSVSTNANAIGLISGYVEGGVIDDVNVYGNISLGANIGRCFVGTAVGIIGGTRAKISNTTTSGSITGVQSASYTSSAIAGYVTGSAISGVVGYINDAYASLDTILSAVTINAPYYNSANDLAVGGVIGAGYTNNVTKLKNKGDITISGSNYTNLYVAGVIGRIVGVKMQISFFHNQGDISVSATCTNLYIAGVVNADIQTSSTISGTALSASLHTNSASKNIFHASSFTNGGLLKVLSKSNNVMYSGVANILAANGFLSTISGFYNLTYKYDTDNTSKIFDKTALSINMYYVPKFAAVVTTNATNSNGLIEASTIYNFKKYAFVTTQDTSIAYSYSGCINGRFVTGDEFRNEGNLSFSVTNKINSNIIVTGVITEVSSGAKITSVYNAGNITINYTATITGDIYASGICYANYNGFSESEILKFDPSDESYDDNAVGSINYCINNGAIEVTNPNYANITNTNNYDIKSANGSVTTERHFYPSSTPSANLVGDICVSGITNYNYSVITNTFNVADMFAANYITAKVKNEINASGLVTYNIGRYAVIENSANDGVIKAINLSFYMVFSNGQSTVNTTTAQYAFVNASGIVCHNDENADGTTYNNGNNHSKQIIAFTINYGSVYSYNVARNSTSSAVDNFRTISAGILGQGLLNLVNVVNYGNIYGSEVSGGIVGVMFFDSFNTEVKQSNEVTLANTINYANILVIDKGELNYRDSSYYTQSYSSFKALNSSSTCYYTSLPLYSKDYFNGSIFGIINFSGSSNANYVTIRYLISFNEDVTLVGAEAQTPSTVTVDLSTFYSAYITFDGTYTLDTYIGSPVVYAPLSTGTEKVNGTTYYGVFNNNFSFRQAINGNDDYLDIANYPTDQFVSDYFEFVGATYINQSLLNTIGWGSIAYNAAADSFATDLNGVAKFIDYLSDNSSTQYNNLITAALSTDTWISKCDEQTLLAIVDTLIENEDDSSLLAMLEYIFSSSSTSYSLISTEIRTNILERLIESDASLDYSTLIDSIITYSNNYSSVLADSILNNDAAGTYIYNYLSSKDTTTLERILTTYCEYLQSQATNSYFTYSNNEKVRYDILTAIFAGIDDEEFYENLSTVLGIDTSSISVSDQISMYNGLTSLGNTKLVTLYKAILLNNSYANIATYINGMSSEIDYYINMINRGYLKTSLTNIYNDTSATSSSTATTVVDERIALWNQIRTTETFANYLQTKIPGEYIAKATEVNNTYQTTTYPYESANSSQGDLSFTYTFDITPATYFLGPYKSTSKDQFTYVKMEDSYAPTCGDTNQTARSVIDVTTKAEADYLYENGYTNYYQLFYYEYSDSSSNNQLCSVRRYINGTIENKYAFTWFKTSNTDFTGGFLHGTYTDVNDSWVEGETWVDGEIWVTDTAGVTFDANGGGISKFTSNSSGTTGENGYASNLTKTGTWVITDANQKQHTISGTLTEWADFIIAHEIRHYVSYPTTKLHSTLNTGLGKYRSGNRWFVWNGNPVYTSQYIDYTYDQLLELDGYLTAYQDGTTASNDERNIINTIFNTYFVTDSTNFKNMVAAALLERNAQVDNDSYYYVGTPAFNATTKIYYRLTVTPATSYNANTTYYTKVGNNYIVANNVTSTNYANYYTVTATRVNDYYNYNDCYQLKTVDEYDADYIKDFMVTNIYTETNINSTTPFEYLNVPTYLQSGSLITVKAYLSGLSSSDIKEKFIGYCANNQQAYAKLLLELMKLNSMDFDMSDITFPIEIGNSYDEDQDISISNLSYYSSLSVVDSLKTFNGESYEYGLGFEILRITVPSTATKLVLYLSSNSANTLFYEYSGETTSWTHYTTVNGNSIIEIPLNSNVYVDIAISSDNTAGDILLYNAYIETTTVAQTVTGTYTYTLLDEPSTTPKANKPGYLIYKLPTATEIETVLSSYFVSQGISPDFTYTVSTLSVTTYNFNSGGNSWQRYHRLIVDTDGSTSTTTGTTLGTSSSSLTTWQTYTYTTANGANYLGRYLGLLVSENRNSASNWSYLTYTTSAGFYRHQFKNITLTINYSYKDGEDTVEYQDLLNQSTIEDAALKKSNVSVEERLSNTFKGQNNYSILYDNLLVDATRNLVPIDYSSTLDSSDYTGTASKNIIEILGLNAEHEEGVNPEYCVPELLNELIASSNEAFAAFIENAVSISADANNDYKVILDYLASNVGYYPVNDAITNQKSSLSTESKEVIAAAYLTSDYKTILTNETSVYNSNLRSYIDSSVSSGYRYINSDGTYDSDKFEDFANLIGYNLSTSGYGIYALSSNHGKLNGEFIPDNLVLGKMDVNYAYSSEGESYVITNSESSSWRGNSTTDGDVQYAFDVEMKQLVKSISTAIFELDLISSEDVTLYSSESSIDLVEKTITYYVPKGSTYTNSLTINTQSMVLANNATLYLNGVLVTKGTTTASFALNVGENDGLIRVYAENTSVYDDYTLIIVEADFSFDLKESHNTASGSYEVAYKDGSIVLNVTSPSTSEPTKDKLPQGMDLTPYISIQSLTGEIMNNAFTLNNSPVVDENGSATIDMSILVTLPTGTYDIVLNIYGTVQKYRFIKNPSTECDITSFVYQGNEIVSSFTQESASVYVTISNVLFGRAFSYEELVEYTSADFYLTGLEYSNGASISVNATYTEESGLITYLVTYVVTAENGNTKTYKHYIAESAPYKSGSQYVSSFIDGVQYAAETKNYSNVESNNVINFSFRRGSAPVFRVKYNLAGFYILGDVEYSYEYADEYEDGTISTTNLTAGISIVVENAADAGTYTVYYKYISTGDWQGVTYIRDYEFPAINITKLASTNAQLESITFISSASKLSTLSTVMYPLGPIRPTGDDLVTADNEVSYDYLSSDISHNLINVTSEKISYNEYDSESYKNYYIVGAVSNVDLSSYAPSFDIEEYAQIYQYTTLSKLKEYGSDNNQTKTDKTVLENTDQVFIYVPYVDENNHIKIFLIKVDMNNGYKWTAAYQDSWNGTDASTVTSFDTKTHAIVFEGSNYTVSPLAGKADSKNASLYMNYIGNPLTDSDNSDDIDDSHFWYVSYVVFSEDALVNGTDKIKFYHVSMIDLENTNYFVFEIKAPTTFTENTIYMTLSYRVYDDSDKYSYTKTLSLFADYDTTSGTYKVYVPNYSITLLPRAYYDFTLSLPGGYEASYTVTNNKKNCNKNDAEEGKYLPPASLIIQEIDITITITETAENPSGVWSKGTSSTYAVTATEKDE